MSSETSQTEITEISLGDVMDFLVCYRRLIALWVLFGLVMASVYLVLKPGKFEAHWQVQMAQFISSNSTSVSNTVSNIEEPAALVQRLRIPTAYPDEVAMSCGMPADREFGDYLGGLLKAEAVKSSNNIIDLKVIGTSPSQAKECAEGITRMIAAQQRDLIKVRLAGSQEQLDQYRRTLKEEQQELEKQKNSETSSFGYLVKWDQLSWLRTRIDALQEEVLESQLRPAKLVAPVYAPNKPVPRKFALLLSFGIAFGLMLGLLNALVIRTWRRRTPGN